MSVLKESYNDTDLIDSTQYIDSSTWAAQSFTASESYTIESVKLVLNWYNSIPSGNVTVSIRETTEFGGGTKPTGGDLCSGTVACSSLPEYPAKTWTEITFDTPYALTKDVVYAIVVRTGVASPDIIWREDASSPTYSGGNYSYSTNAGSFWLLLTTIDFMFETYALFAAPVDVVTIKKLVVAAANKIYYEDI
jgi:hypothetical protein